MDSIQKIENTFRLFLAISIISIILIFVTYESIYEYELIHVLTNILLPTIFTVTIGIYIYLRQQRDKYSLLFNSLKIYLEYINESLEREGNEEDISDLEFRSGHLNNSAINVYIESGYFIDILDDLIIFESSLNLYLKVLTPIFLGRFFENEEKAKSYLDRLINMQKEIVKQSTNILSKLDDKTPIKSFL